MMKKILSCLVCAAVVLSLAACGKDENSSSLTADSSTSTNNSAPAESNINVDFKERTSMFEFLPPITKQNSEDEFICEEEGVGVKITGTTAQGKALWIPDKLYGKPVLGVNLPKAEFEEIIMPDTVQIFSVNFAKVKYMNIPRNIQYDRSTDGYDMPETDEIVLEAIYFDDGISEIMGMFAGESLKRVSLPDSLTTLGKCAFSGCSGLTDLVIPENVKKIDPTAFEGCENIRVKYGELVFTYDERLALSLESTCDENGISHTVFEQSRWGDYEEKTYDDRITYCSRKIEKLTVPANIANIYVFSSVYCPEGLEKRDRLQSIEVAPENENYYSKDGVLFLKDGAQFQRGDKLMFYPNAKPDKSYTVPDNVSVNYDQGRTPFSNCIYLQNLEVSSENELYSSEDGVLYSKNRSDNERSNLQAFPGGKTEYDLPDDIRRVETILPHVRSLKSINVSKTNDFYRSEDGVLYYKNQLLVYPLGRTDTEYTLPDGIALMRGFEFGSTGIYTNPYLKTIVYKGKSYTHDEFLNELYDAIEYGESGVRVNESGALIGVSRYAEEIVIPDTVTSIDKNAFNDRDKLKSVKYKGRTYTKDELDELCELLNPERGLTISSDGKLTKVSPELTEVKIPDRVTEIANVPDTPAFFGCENLKKVTFGNGVTEIKGDYFVQRDVNVFGGWGYNVTEIIIPEGVTSIGFAAFWQLESLTSITIPSSLTVIGEYAFANCSSLTSITIPDGVTLIERGAFSNCTGLTRITIPDSVTHIGTAAVTYVDAFDGCTNIKATYKGKTYDYTHIDDLYKAINGDTDGLTITSDGVLTAVSPELTEVVIPDRVTDIANIPDTPAFRECTKLKKVTFGKGMTGISGSYFARSTVSVLFGCDNLNEIIIPTGITYVGGSAFEDLPRLEKVDLPEGLEAIGDLAFASCTNLKKITIPDSVTKIAAYVETEPGSGINFSNIESYGAFYNCENIKVTYKGKTYDYAHIDDLYKAINGN